MVLIRHIFYKNHKVSPMSTEFASFLSTYSENKIIKPVLTYQTFSFASFLLVLENHSNIMPCFGAQVLGRLCLQITFYRVWKGVWSPGDRICVFNIHKRKALHCKNTFYLKIFHTNAGAGRVSHVCPLVFGATRTRCQDSYSLLTQPDKLISDCMVLFDSAHTGLAMIQFHHLFCWHQTEICL